MILQRFKDGKLADARVFKKADGLTWLDKGFPRSTSFGPEGLSSQGASDVLNSALPGEA